MTQVAFLKKSEIPKVQKIEKDIQSLGYNFEIRNKENELISEEGLECIINGHKTYFEIYVIQPEEIVSEMDFVKSELTNEDIGISFVWGSDFAAGACIGLVSIALIDNVDAKIFYLDDEIKYTREMLLNDTPQFLNELTKLNKHKTAIGLNEEKGTKKKLNIWGKLINRFRK